MYCVTKRVEFCGAHSLELGYDSPCKNLHGHNWIVSVSVEGEHLNEEGMLMDFKVIKEIINQLDHTNLNGILPTNPTAENIAKWIADHVQNHLDHYDLPSFTSHVTEVTIQESEGNTACYTP